MTVPLRDLARREAARAREGAADEEQRALRDRANVALGFAALGNQLGADARRYFERVRLHGADSGKALLGYGWAMLELGEPKHALVPFGDLRERPVSDPASVEAHIAVPYALAEAGAGGAAHLPGMVAAITPLPVIGVPVKAAALEGLDSLLSIVQMPAGVPVATVAFNNAQNAGILAAQILGGKFPEIRRQVKEYKMQLEAAVLKKAGQIEKR